MTSIAYKMRANIQAKGQTSKTANNKQRVNKLDSKQMVVSVMDKCRFGSDIHSLIVLKHGRHTNKQDSCMNM